MPEGSYKFISLHTHTMRREFFQDDAYEGFSISSLIPLKSIQKYGLAQELDFAGYGKPPIEIYDSFDEIPDVLPEGKFLVIEADVPMGRYWIPVIAMYTGPDGSTRYKGQFCLHFI
jgi:hypothetical protein